MKNILVKSNITIRQAMKVLEKTSEKCLLIIDNNKKLLGTLSDGDLRRSVLQGKKFSEKISDSYNKNPSMLIKDKYTKKEAEKLLHTKRLDLIPIVNDKQIVIDYINWIKINGVKKTKTTLSSVSVAIMAGGKGTRMRPFTNILPKPLIPIRDKPIMQHIIEKFNEYGCKNFHIMVNYKSKILKAYFDELQHDYDLNFIKENKPLGTAGSLRYLTNKISSPLFVTNCDIIIKADYDSLYNFHEKGKYDLTLVASAKEYIIPYGTCELNEYGHLLNINEKPKYDFLINTGLYIVNPDLLESIPENKFYHITHLIDEAIIMGKKIGVFPISEDAWIDVGQWSEYKKVIERL